MSSEVGALRGALFVDLKALISKPSRELWMLAAAYVLLALGSVEDLPAFRSLPPLELWLWGSGLLLLVAASYFVSIALCVWVGRKQGVQAPESAGQPLIRATAQLMLPLSILGIRGLLLFTFGLFVGVLPGLYFAFKYQLASLSLAQEGWVLESPVKRAEVFIRSERWWLLGLMAWMALDPLLSLSGDLFMDWMGWERGLILRVCLALILGSAGLVIDLVMAAAFCRLVKKYPVSSV